MHPISVVIPVYKQKEQFLANLSHNMQFLHETEIIIVNDDPETELKHELEHKQVTLVENSHNLGFAGAVNRGFDHAHRPYVLLLNSDTVLNDVNYLHALTHFEHNKKLFAVGFAQTEHDGTMVGKNRLYWKNGFVHHEKASDFSFGITAWAEGGSSLFHKEKFDHVHGFDVLYSPFYWEDVDLSYRAWKAGYEVLFEPAIVVQHHHGMTTSSNFTKKTIHITAFRNQLLFIWKNIHDSKLLQIHKRSLLKLLMSETIKGNTIYLKGYREALKRKHLIKSHGVPSSNIFNDVELLKKLEAIT